MLLFPEASHNTMKKSECTMKCSDALTTYIMGILAALAISAAALPAASAQGNAAPVAPAARFLSLEARRQIIRQRIAASAFPEVEQEAEQVESAVLSTGHYAVDLTKHPPVHGWLNASRWPKIVLMALQDLAHQRAAVRAYSPATSGQPDAYAQAVYEALKMESMRCAQGTCSGNTSLKLRGVLMAKLAGLSQPVSLCTTSDLEAMDVTPCIEPSALRISSPVAQLDPQGVLRLVQKGSIRDLASAVHAQPNLSIPVGLPGNVIINVELPIYFMRLDKLTFDSDSRAGESPNLKVWADARDPQRLVFTIQHGNHVYDTVIERKDVGDFSIVSRGTVGTPGAFGQDGTGGSGGPGGPGGPGGRGGDVSVQVACGAADCKDTIDLLRGMIRSEGGFGGTGGLGGRARSGTVTHCHEYGYYCFNETIVVNETIPDGENGQNGQQGLPGSVRLDSGPDWVTPPPAFEPPPTVASPEMLRRVKTQLEQAMASNRALLSACRSTYGQDQGAATAHLTVSPGGNVKDAHLDGVGSGLAVCLERWLKTLTIAKIPERNIAVEHL